MSLTKKALLGPTPSTADVTRGKTDSFLTKME